MRNHDYDCAKKNNEDVECNCSRSYPVKVWDGIEDLGDLSDGYIYDFKRSVVIECLSTLMMEDEDYDENDDYAQIFYESMTNEELESHFCMSGFVHDGFMHEVIDD